jgi:hypothetical protein
MTILITAQSQQTPGPELEIACPKCNAPKTSATSYEQRDRLSLFYLVPLFAITNTFVECASCNAKLTSRLSVHELDQHSGSDISQFLSFEMSFVVKFLALTSMLLFFAPIIGLVLAIFTVVLSSKSGGWPRALGLVALVLSGIVTIASVALLALEAIGIIGG